MHKQSKKERFEEFRKICRENGLNVTPQRIAVYEVLAGAKNHPSAEEIFRCLVSDFPELSIDTVYRTLNTFAQIGLIRIVEGYGEARRYDPDTQPHHHFRCLKCSRIVDFENPEFSRLKIPDVLQRKCRITGVKVVLEGLCEECLNR